LNDLKTHYKKYYIIKAFHTIVHKLNTNIYLQIAIPYKKEVSLNVLNAT